MSTVTNVVNNDLCRSETSPVDEVAENDPLTNVVKYLDDFVAEQQRKRKAAKIETAASLPIAPIEKKKLGGVAKTATQTISKHGCRNNEQCQSNTRNPVELCIVLAREQSRKMFNPSWQTAFARDFKAGSNEQQIIEKEDESVC